MADEEPSECRWCGNAHGKLCPYVKALEFNGIGDTVTRVEFLTPIDCPQAKIEPRNDAEPGYATLGPKGPLNQ